MMNRIGLTFILTLVLASTATAGFASDYRVVVNPNNPIDSIERKFLAEVFLKKATFWESSQIIQPVDLSPHSSTRRKFSEAVLNRSVSEIRNYWQQRIFSGRDIPPPELSTDGEVIRYVLQRQGAIGYVSESANTDQVKVVSVR
jgi:ABC-type phosphate transport system substrate-binding protein